MYPNSQLPPNKEGHRYGGYGWHILPEALADAMSESCSKICGILETDAAMKGAKACSPHKIAGKRS